VTRAQEIAHKYGFDAGGIESNGNTDLEEYALKLDWNINENHRANIRYSKLDQNKLRINGMGSPAGFAQLLLVPARQDQRRATSPRCSATGPTTSRPS
jgi:hypothetical protein